MRNLKKVLSLALAMVMLLGMMVVGAGAATSFSDDDKIADSRKVAVAVANKIGVLQGVGDNTFNPDGTLTRAEAAVVLAKLDLGADAASALTATNAATFDDVGTGYGWAKAYIDYCAGNGYMVGVGGNNFAPGRTLTSVEFATMVCRVLGYKDENEYGKDGWTVVKAAALARKAGLGADVAIANADMSRADMAQMVLNALTAPMVEYTGLNGSIGDATFSSPATVRVHSGDQILKGDTTYTNTPATATTPIRLCEERFPDLKLNKTVDDETFGRTLSVWTWKRVEIAGTEDTVEPDAVFTAATKEADVKKEIGKAESDDCTLFTNGQAEPWADDNDAGDIAKLTGNGRLIEVYLDDNYKDTITKIVVVDTALGEVTKVDSKNEKITIKLEKHDMINASGKAEEGPVDGAPALTTEIGYGEFKKGDIVLVQGWYNGATGKENDKLNSKTTVTSVVEAPKVVGLARQKNYSDTTITVDGEARKMSYGFVKDYGFADFAVNNTYDCTLYLDNYDNIIKAIKGAKTNVVDDNLIAVKDTYTSLEGGKLVYKISGTLSNGETASFNVPTDGDLTGKLGKICTYVDNKNGTYNVTPVTTSNVAGDVTKDKLYVSNTNALDINSKDSYGKGNGSDYMYADDVKFIFVESDGNTTVLNGRQTQSIANGTVTAQALRVAKWQADGKTPARYEIIAVFIANEPDVVDISDIIYVHKGSSESTQVSDDVVDDADGNKKTIYGYVAYDSNGEPIENFYGTKDNMAHKFFKKNTTTIGEYTVHKNTTTNSMTKHTVADATVVHQNGLRGDAFVLNINKAETRFLGGGAKIVDLSGKWIEDISELNEMADENDVVISVIYNDNSGSDTKSALTIFVESVEPKPGNRIWFNEDGTPKDEVTLTTLNKYDPAITVAAGKTLTITKDLVGTVNVTGGELIVKGDVDGTVSVSDAAAEVTVNGDVGGTMNVTAGTVEVKGTVTGELNTQTGAKVSINKVGAGADVTVNRTGSAKLTEDEFNVKSSEEVVKVESTGNNQLTTGTIWAGYKGVWTSNENLSGTATPTWNTTWNMYAVNIPAVDNSSAKFTVTYTNADGALVYKETLTRDLTAGWVVYLPMKAIGYNSNATSPVYTYGYPSGTDSYEFGTGFGFASDAANTVVGVPCFEANQRYTCTVALENGTVLCTSSFTYTV